MPCSHIFSINDGYGSHILYEVSFGTIFFTFKSDLQKSIKVMHRVAKFPGILIALNFHREFWGNIGNFRKFSETWEFFKISIV